MTLLAKIRGLLAFNEEGCWEWQGAVSGGDGGGYATTTTRGRTVLVHRFMWENFNGPIPPDKQIDHLCRNRRCVNPQHLELVTSKENTLRGTGPTAQNARKTHCKNGHEFTPENTYMSRKGRECRACKRDLSRLWMREQRAHAALASGKEEA